MAVKYKSISAAKKAGSIYYYDKNGTKQLAVTKETLDAWKKKNKGSYKGSSLTAWANAKGKDLKKKEEIQVRKLSPSTVGKGRGDGEMELFQRKVDKRKAESKKGPVRKGDGTGAGTKTAKKALNNSAESPPQTLKRLEKEMQALQAARTARMDKMKKMKAEAAKLLKDSKPKPSTKEAVEAAKLLKDSKSKPKTGPKTPDPAIARNKAKTSAAAANKARLSVENEKKRRVKNARKNPDELSTEGFNSVKRTGRKGVSLTKEELAKMNKAYPRAKMNMGGMSSSYSPGGSVAKPMVMKNGKKVPAYAADGVGKMNMGGMAKKKYSYGGLTRSSVNNMKKGRG